MKNILFSFCLLLLVGNISYSQVSNTGSWGPDYEVVEKCVDSLDLHTNYISYYEVQTLRAGQTTVIAKYRANGSTFTPPAGKQNVGSCPSTTTITADSIREIVVIALCDDNTGNSVPDPFWRIVQRTYWPATGAGTITILSTFKQDGSSYTPVGAVSEGPCFITAFDAETHAEISANVTYTAPVLGFSSWEIHNVGLTIITMQTGGTTVNLYPGESRYCKEEVNWDMRHTRVCGTVLVNASGGTAHVYLRAH